jgi:probable rRNA maturation factor
VIAVEISGCAIPRLSRRELASFTRSIVSVLQRAGATRFSPACVSIAFVDDAVMKRLNRRYRRKNHTTDILTFPGEPPQLGELVISVDQARRQARQERHSLADEVRYLVVHGVLHAFGYDHENDRGEMNALELRIREEVGLS